MHIAKNPLIKVHIIQNRVPTVLSFGVARLAQAFYSAASTMTGVAPAPPVDLINTAVPGARGCRGRAGVLILQAACSRTSSASKWGREPEQYALGKLLTYSTSVHSKNCWRCSEAPCELPDTLDDTSTGIAAYFWP